MRGSVKEKWQTMKMLRLRRSCYSNDAKPNRCSISCLPGIKTCHSRLYQRKERSHDALERATNDCLLPFLIEMCVMCFQKWKGFFDVRFVLQKMGAARRCRMITEKSRTYQVQSLIQWVEPYQNVRRKRTSNPPVHAVVSPNTYSSSSLDITRVARLHGNGLSYEWRSLPSSYRILWQVFSYGEQLRLYFGHCVHLYLLVASVHSSCTVTLPWYLSLSIAERCQLRKELSFLWEYSSLFWKYY